MFAIRNLVKTNPQVVRNVIQQRNMSVVCTPARNKVPTAEKVGLALIMVLGWTAIPAYVLVNLKHYRSHE